MILFVSGESNTQLGPRRGSHTHIGCFSENPRATGARTLVQRLPVLVDAAPAFRRAPVSKSDLESGDLCRLYMYCAPRAATRALACCRPPMASGRGFWRGSRRRRRRRRRRLVREVAGLSFSAIADALCSGERREDEGDDDAGYVELPAEDAEGDGEEERGGCGEDGVEEDLCASEVGERSEAEVRDVAVGGDGRDVHRVGDEHGEEGAAQRERQQEEVRDVRAREIREERIACRAQQGRGKGGTNRAHERARAAKSAERERERERDVGVSQCTSKA